MHHWPPLGVQGDSAGTETKDVQNHRGSADTTSVGCVESKAYVSDTTPTLLPGPVYRVRISLRLWQKFRKFLIYKNRYEDHASGRLPIRSACRSPCLIGHSCSSWELFKDVRKLAAAPEQKKTFKRYIRHNDKVDRALLI